MGYAGAGRMGALGEGLYGLGEMLVKGRQEDERERLFDLQQSRQYASDAMLPGAISPTQMGSAAFDMPSDAVVLPTGIAVSKQIEREEAARERAVLWREKLDQTTQLANLEDYNKAYGPKGQGDRAFASFLMGQYPDQIPEGTPVEGALQMGEFLAAQDRANRPTAPRAAAQPSAALLQHYQDQAEQIYGQWEEFVNPNTQMPEYIRTGWKGDLTDADVYGFAQRMAAGEAPPDPSTFGGGAASAQSWRNEPGQFGAWAAPTQTTAAPTTVPSGAAPPPRTVTPTALDINDTRYNKGSNESQRGYAERLATVGFTRDQVMAILRRQGLIQ